jgi:hypothetical protein
MFKLTARSLSRAAALALTGAGVSIVLVATAAPAIALCRYGSPNCVNPRPNFDYQIEESVSLDSVTDGWTDPDCKYYGNCLSDNNEDEQDARCRFNGNCEDEARSTPPNRLRAVDGASQTTSIVRQRR